MDRQEIRMRCLEAAQLATKTPAVASANGHATVIEWAGRFEAYVVGTDDPPATAARGARTKPATKPEGDQQ